MSSDARSRRASVVVIQILLGLALSSLFVFLAFQNVDLAELSNMLERAHVVWLALALLAQVGAHGLRLWRWWGLLRPLGGVSRGEALRVGAIGCLATFVLPARLGEIVRPAMITRERGVALGAASATIVTERLVDGVCISALMLLSLLALPADQVDAQLQWGGISAALIFCAGSVCAIAASLLYPLFEPRLAALSSRTSSELVKKVTRLLESFFEGLALLREPGVCARYLVQTLGIWLMTTLSLIACLHAMELDGLGPIAAVMVMSTAVLGTAIPSAPTNLGVFHWAVVFSLGMLAVDAPQALAVATFFHLAILLANLIYGCAGWWLGDYSGKLVASVLGVGASTQERDEAP